MREGSVKADRERQSATSRMKGLFRCIWPPRPHPASPAAAGLPRRARALVAGAAPTGRWSRSTACVLKADGGFKPQRLPRNQLRADRIPGPRRHPIDDRQAAAGADRSDPRIRPRRAPADQGACRSARPRRSQALGTAAAPQGLRRGDRRHRHDRPDALLRRRARCPAHAPLTLFNGPPLGRQPDGHRPRPHRLAGQPDLRRRRSRSNAISGEYALPRHFDTPGLSGGRRADPRRRQDRPPLQVQRRERSYVSARCTRRHLPHPRPLRLRRRHHHRRRDRKGLRAGQLLTRRWPPSAVALPILAGPRAVSSVGRAGDS